MNSRDESRTQTIKASDARQRWSELLNQVFKGRTRVIVEKSGIPVAAVISTADLERLERFEAQRQQRFASLEATWEAFDDVASEEIVSRIAEALDEVRLERAAPSDQAPEPS
jgi:prevent-host-death family protein